MRAEASFGVELCSEEGAFLFYDGGKPSALKAKDVGSKWRKVLSSMVSAGKK